MDKHLIRIVPDLGFSEKNRLKKAGKAIIREREVVKNYITIYLNF